jgi:hypothetical protein
MLGDLRPHRVVAFPMKAGRRQLAIDNYRKSIELDLGNENGIQMLEQLLAEN